MVLLTQRMTENPKVKQDSSIALKTLILSTLGSLPWLTPPPAVVWAMLRLSRLQKPSRLSRLRGVFMSFF